MNYCKYLKKVWFVIPLSFINYPAYAGKGDFGCIWSDVLNFTHATLQVNTGPKGNLKYINGEDFDIDNIHKELKKTASKTSKNKRWKILINETIEPDLDI